MLWKLAIFGFPVSMVQSMYIPEGALATVELGVFKEFEKAHYSTEYTKIILDHTML